MRHGIAVGHGFKTGDRVKITSRRLHFDAMPATITGTGPPGFLRARVCIGTGNMCTSVWVKPSELKKARRR